MISNLEIRIAGASQAREQMNKEFNDLVITRLTVTQLLVLQVFRVESKYALCSLLKLMFFQKKKKKENSTTS